MDYLLQKRSNLEIELVAINHALRWLREHHRKAISKEMATTFGAETRIPPAPEDKTSGLGLGHVEAHGHPGSSDDRARSRSRAPAADAELNRDARRGDGGGQDGRCDAGRGRGGKRVSVPPFLCRVCWNEARGLRPAGAHAKGTGDVECRLAPDQPVAKGTEAIKSAAKKAVDRAGSRAAGAGPAQAPAQLAKSGEEADALDVQEQAASPTAAEDPAHAPAAKELPKGGGKADALGAQLPAAEQSAAAEGHEPAQQEPGAAPPAGEEEGNPSSASPLGSSDRRKFDDLFSSPEGRGDANF